MGWNASGQTGSAAYTYVPNSDLLQGFSSPNGLATAYGYEPHRNLKTAVQNSFNSQLVSGYAYVYDPLGRRASVADSGSAFAQAAHSAYIYNDRSELIAADRYLGAEPQDATSPVAAEQRGYLYDPIGNRTQDTAAGVQTGYSTNALNQYSAVTGPDAFTPSYDADGNLKNTADGTTYTYNAENRLITRPTAIPA